MKAMKRLTALVIMLCVLACALPMTVSAASSGTCGANLTWTLDSAGTLTISGSGKMYNYEWGGPWYEYSDSIIYVVINSGVTSVGATAFADCYNLNTVSIADTVTQIGDYAFAYDNALVLAAIPDSVTSIGVYAFAFCSELKYANIPSRVTSIGEGAFLGTGLTAVTIPASATEIGDAAFAGCSNLSKISVASGNPSFTSDSSGVLFNKSKTALLMAPGLLSGNYTVPGTVTSISYGAFVGCYKLKEVSIPASVTNIGAFAFESCTGLNKIVVAQSNQYYSSDNYGVLFNKAKTVLIQAPGALSGHYFIPSTVNTVSDLAFEYCTSLKGVTIPASVNEMGYGIFFGCVNLTSATLAHSIARIPDSTFAACIALKNITIPSTVTYIGEQAFAECQALSSITIPSGVLDISNYAFAGCISLKSVTIPDSVFNLGESAFAYCTGLTSVTVGSGVETIGPWAFDSCEKLTRVQIKEGVREIGESAFAECGNLTNIEVPASLEKVSYSAFAGCNKLATVFYGGKTTDKGGIGHYGDVYNFLDADWHYECVELQGAYPAYYCGECDKCYFLDNTESHFTDVLTNNWQFIHAKYAVDNSLMAGVGSDAYGRVTFLPDKAISREEFVQVLYNAEGKPPVSSSKEFPDVVDDAWYENAVLWAFENNIASGLGDGSFGIGRNITRQDLALMLYKYAGLCGYSQDATMDVILQYGDGSTVSGYAKIAMDWAVTNGILSGKGTAGKPLSTFRLDPAGTATRAECAAMLRNFMTKFNP